jgi:Protein of unknown function (DUF2975)
MEIVTVSTSQQSQKFFARMNTAFWVMWALLPVMFGLVIYTLHRSETFTQGLTPEQIKVMGDKLSFGQGSLANAVAIWFELAYEIGFYVLLFAILHRMIRQFMRGSIFVGSTLARVQTLGWILVAYPFVSNLIINTSNFILSRLGEPTLGGTAGVSYIIDLGPIAVGLFLVALKHVLHHAMQMKFENDLTI